MLSILDTQTYFHCCKKVTLVKFGHNHSPHSRATGELKTAKQSSFGVF